MSNMTTFFPNIHGLKDTNKHSLSKIPNQPFLVQKLDIFVVARTFAIRQV